METGGIVLTGKTEILCYKPVQTPLCLQEVSHGIALNRSWVFKVKSRRLIAAAMARA
jgi:hypothetical protein